MKIKSIDIEGEYGCYIRTIEDVSDTQTKMSYKNKDEIQNRIDYVNEFYGEQIKELETKISEIKKLHDDELNKLDEMNEVLNTHF